MYASWITDKAPMKTLYFGGGTPSSLKPELICEFVQFLRTEYGDAFRPVEFTLEVNPEDVTNEAVDAWLKAGVTRFSMGVQSMITDELRSIGRRHTPEVIREKAALLGANAELSLDLICGLPGQTIDSFRHSLDEMLNLQPGHLSVYMLELEEGSALMKLVAAGRKNIPDDAIVANMYITLCKNMREAGYQHYEISNFAKPGKNSLHNSAYWDGTPYLGFGPSASGYPQSDVRYRNAADLSQYIKSGPQPIVESLTKTDLITEHVLTRLRTSKGIDLQAFAAAFGYSQFAELTRKAKPYIADNLLTITDNRLHLSSPRACLLSDAIMLNLL